MTEKLIPCPFCGEESNIYLGDSTDGYIRGTQFVEAYCNKCGARIKRRLVSEAIEAWNTRPSPWHTGTPTEEGWYLIAFNYEFEEGVRYTTDYFKDGKWAFPMVRDISKLRAWQKIEPYKETE